MAKKVKEKKEPKRKPKYGMLSCVGYMYSMLWQYNRWLVFAGIFTVPLSLILSALALYTPSLMLSSLETSDRFSKTALVIIGLLAAKLLFNLSNHIINQKIGNSEHYVLLRMMYIAQSRRRDRDWYLDLDPKVQELNNRADDAVSNNHSAGVHFPMDFSNMLSQILNFILFGSVISLLSPVIILLLAAGCFVNYLMGRWERYKNREGMDARNSVSKKISYIAFDVSREFKFAKDVRLYSMGDYISNKINGLFIESENEQKKVELNGIITAIVSFAVVLIRDGAAYAFLIYQAVRGEMDASSFVLYFSAITSMSGVMGGILGTINRVFDGAMQVSDFREGIDIPDKLNRGKGIPVPTSPFTIEFKNVSFTYPQCKNKVLDNISFKIEAGEKIALVGLNGAGKTTLTMMMCGLLLPDEGEVLLDGHSLMEYNRDEMYSLFGVVPQQYNIMPISIAQNISCTADDEEIDYELLRKCIETAGLSEKIASLPKGIETPLSRELYTDGIELSGGEAQKLLLARLLYKNPPCIILDEPTAALDPIAEDRMYHKYNEIASGATSVFISHRLASTRFCNRIFLLDGANFAEVGNHDELMALGGKYRELFDIQSKYYRESSEKIKEEVQ